MTMYNLYLFSYNDISKDWEEREDGGEGCSSIYDQEGDMIDLQSVREISYACSPFVCVCDYDHFVASIDQFRGQLVDVTFDAS